MLNTRAIPTSRFGNAFRVILVVGGLLAIVGIADAARALFWLVLNGATGAEDPFIDFLKVGLRLVAWSLAGITAYIGWRRNVIPATWMLTSLVILCWVLILAQRSA
jgi:uncharacterized membrane protein AbrB (regulator of aidB expression)